MNKAQLDPFFSLLTTGSEAKTRQALVQFCEWLSQQASGRELSGTVELVLAEALNNIAEHAYAQLPPGPVQIDANLISGSLTVRLRDCGHLLPNAVMPEGRLPDTDVPLESLPEGGFGWFLIHNLTQHLSYQHVGGENHLELRFDTNLQSG